MAGRCARLWEIDPYREGRLGAKGERSFERHLRVCSECREQICRDERLRDLGRALGHDEPSELVLRRVRAKVLRDASAGAAAASRARRSWLLAAALLLVAVGAGGWSLWSTEHGSRTLEESGPERQRGAVASAAPSMTAAPVEATQRAEARSCSPPLSCERAEAYAGSVVASGDARWSQGREHGIERVVLESGRLSLHVRPQALGERFLISLPDGELEVRGTTFEIEVEGGFTKHVAVSEGVVELRLEAREAIRLEAGATWPPAAPRPGGAAVAPAPAASAHRVPGSQAIQETDAYRAAMAMLQGGRNEEAAAAFHAYAQTHPAAPLAEDASFLEAVALARAGRADAAALAAERHLAAFPVSFHRRDAAILAARASAQRGECAKAQALLAAWSGKGDPEVEASLRPCDGAR
jgi:hypothetical protein